MNTYIALCSYQPLPSLAQKEAVTTSTLVSPEVTPEGIWRSMKNLFMCIQNQYEIEFAPCQSSLNFPLWITVSPLTLQPCVCNGEMTYDRASMFLPPPSTPANFLPLCETFNIKQPRWGTVSECGRLGGGKVYRQLVLDFWWCSAQDLFHMPASGWH